MIQHILAATRPVVSLDATLDQEARFSLKNCVSGPAGDCSDAIESREIVEKLVVVLRPREQQVLSLRFGLGGGDRLSLSQVGKVLRRLLVEEGRVHGVELPQLVEQHNQAARQLLVRAGLA